MGDTFRIYLKDLATSSEGDTYWGEGTRYLLGCGLKALYDTICDPPAGLLTDLHSAAGDPVPMGGAAQLSHARMVAPRTSVFETLDLVPPQPPYPSTPFKRSDYWWNPAKASVSGTAVLIYCLRKRGDSLIARRTKGTDAKLGLGGSTHRTGAGAISEIYVEDILSTSGNSMQALIKLAFHESMHNKLEVMVPPGRTPPDMHRDAGLAAAVVAPDATLNETNVRRMRAALARPVPQDTRYL